MNTITPLSLSKPEHLLPPGTYSEQEREASAVNSLCNKFREWAANMGTRVSALHPHRDIYKNLLSLAGGPDANRWHVELAFSQLLHGGGDEPTANQEKLLPVGLRGDSKPEQTPTQITHAEAVEQVKNEIAEREQEEAQELNRITEETQKLNAR